jgi:hypothetical protein
MVRITARHRQTRSLAQALSRSRTIRSMSGSLRWRFLCGVGLLGVLFAGAGASPAANKPLPAGGVRKIVAGPGGQSLLVVLYDIAGNLQGKDLGVSVPAGKRVIGVKIGLQNRSSRTYSSTPAAAARVRTDDGALTRALKLKNTGLGTVVLKKQQAALGFLLFLVGREARFQLLLLKPFAPKGIVVALHSPSS